MSLPCGLSHCSSEIPPMPPGCNTLPSQSQEGPRPRCSPLRTPVFRRGVRCSWGTVCVSGLCVVCNPPTGSAPSPASLESECPVGRACTSQSRTPARPLLTGPLLPGLPGPGLSQALPVRGRLSLCACPSTPPSLAHSVWAPSVWCVFHRVRPPALGPGCHSGTSFSAAAVTKHRASCQRSGAPWLLAQGLLRGGRFPDWAACT